jgi:hypothetical protein
MYVAHGRFDVIVPGHVLQCKGLLFPDSSRPVDALLWIVVHATIRKLDELRW